MACDKGCVWGRSRGEWNVLSYGEWVGWSQITGAAANEEDTPIKYYIGKSNRLTAFRVSIEELTPISRQYGYTVRSY